MNRNFEQLINWGTLLILSLIWGSSFILMKYGLRSFSYGQVAAFRMFVAFILLLPFALQNLKLINKTNVFSLLAVGFIGNCIPAFLFTLAETRIDSSLAGMLNAMTPFFTLIVGGIVYRLHISGRAVIGVVLGLLGSIMLIMADSSGFSKSVNAWAFFVVLATLMYGININHIKENLSHLTGVQISSLAFLFVGPVVSVYLLTSGLSESFAQPNAWEDFVYVFLLGFFGSAVAVVLSTILVQRTNAMFSSSVTYLMPIVAIVWGVIDGEQLSFVHYIGMCIVLFGVYLVNRKNNRR